MPRQVNRSGFEDHAHFVVPSVAEVMAQQGDQVSEDRTLARQTTLETSDALPFDVYVVLVEQHDLTDP